jgi:hypothetical protein
LDVDQTAKFAEVAIIFCALFVVLEDEVVHLVKGDVQLIKQAFAARTRVIPQDLVQGAYGWRRVLAGMRHDRSVSTQPECSCSEQGGQVNSTLYASNEKSKRAGQFGHPVWTSGIHF